MIVRNLLIVALASVTIGSAPFAFGQEDSFDDETDVIEVQVPVNVYLRNGEPVRGLTADDFEVFDDGKRQEITDFQVVDLDLEETHYGTNPAGAIPAAARRHFLLLFDLTFSDTAAIIKAREAAHGFVLNSLHPADLAAVATYSNDSGPKLLVTFTPDRAQLARAIATLGAPRMVDGRVDPLRFVIGNPLSAEAEALANLDLGNENVGGLALNGSAAVRAYLDVIRMQFDRQETSFRRGRATSWTAGLRGLAQALASAEGRKHVVLFSEGFDGRLMLGRPPDANDTSAQLDQVSLQLGQYWMVDTDDIYGNSGLQKDVDVMLEEFRRADCVIQAVDISGLAAEFSDTRRAGQVSEDALFYIANETGGSLYEDANSFSDQLVDVLEKTSVTYVLHFRPKGTKQDGEYHKIEVKARGLKGKRVAHRAGYYAPRPFEDLHPLEKSLLASEAIAAAAPRHDVKMNVLVAAFRANEQQAYVPVIIEVDGQSLLVGHDERRKDLPIELYTYVTNEDGEMRDFFTQLVTINLDQTGPTLERAGIKYYGHLELEPGNYMVRVLARNAATGRVGVESVEVAIPKYELAEPDLLPPFFFEAGDRPWIMVREQRGESNAFDRSVVYPFTVNGSPYVPSARPAIESGGNADLCLVVYNLTDGKLEVEAMVLGADGSEVQPARVDVLERTVTGIRGVDKLLANFKPKNLEAGDYTLRVAVQDPSAGITRSNEIPFTIVN